MITLFLYREADRILMQIMHCPLFSMCRVIVLLQINNFLLYIGLVQKYCLYLSTHIFLMLLICILTKFYKLSYLRKTLFLNVSEVL